MYQIAPKLFPKETPPDRGGVLLNKPLTWGTQLLKKEVHKYKSWNFSFSPGGLPF